MKRKKQKSSMKAKFKSLRNITWPSNITDTACNAKYFGLHYEQWRLLSYWIMTDCLETTKYKLKRKKKEQTASQEYVKSMTFELIF